MSSRPRNWIKLWVSWLTTPAHAELSGGAFGLGPLLLLLSTWDGEYDGGGWLVAPDGAPLSAEALCRLTHRKSIAALNGELSELERCGTLHRRADGALGFPKFGHWQESGVAAAERKREEKRSTHKVYFAVAGALVKIGCSANPWARLATLREHNKGTELRACIAGGFDVERALHQRFAALRVKGEWFRYEGELRDYVVALPVATGRQLQQDERRQTIDGSPLRSEPSIAPLTGSSPPSPPAADVVSPAEPTGGQVLTHPAAEAGAGRQASQRRRAAAELWAWHEGERVRRLCGHATPPRKHTDRDLAAIVRLHAHARKRHGCSEADAWEHVRGFRERALSDAEEALRTERQAYPSVGQQLEWARTSSAWSVKAYDLLAEREPDQKAAQAQADEAYRAEVRRVKAERARQQGGGA